MKNVLSFCGLTLLLLASAFPGQAQTFRGGIAGVITDSSGAILSGSGEKAVNAATGFSSATGTSGPVEFAFQDLPLGVWQVTISHPGFETAVVSNVNVEVGQ